MTKKSDGWWLTHGGEEWGPYPTKAEAEEAVRRMNSHDKAVQTLSARQYAERFTTDREQQAVIIENFDKIKGGVK